MNRHNNRRRKNQNRKQTSNKEKPMQSIQFKDNSTTSRRGTTPRLEPSSLIFAPRVRHSLLLAIATLGLTLIFNPVAASADPQVFEASGVTPNDILNTVNAFRNFLGDNN